MENHVKVLRIIYFTIIVFPSIIIAFVHLFSQDVVMLNTSKYNIYEFIIPILMVIFIPISHILYHNFKKKIRNFTTPEERLSAYIKINVTRISLHSIPLMSILYPYINTLDHIYIFYASIILFMFSFIIPKKYSKVDFEDLNIKFEKSENKSKSINGIRILGFVIFLGVNSQEIVDYFSNRVEIVELDIDKGSIEENVYHNNFLDWTFTIPDGFEPIQAEENEKNIKALGVEAQDDTTKVYLFQLRKEITSIEASVNYLYKYSQFDNEYMYLKSLRTGLTEIFANYFDVDSWYVRKDTIDNIEFKTMNITFENNGNKISFKNLTKFTKNIILNITLSSNDSTKIDDLLYKLKLSKLNLKNDL